MIELSLMKRVVLWGATGQAKVVEEFLDKLDLELVALFDNNPQVRSPFAGVEIFYGVEGFLKWKQSWGNQEAFGVVTIGGTQGRDRIKLQNIFKENKVVPLTVVHPTAYISKHVQVGAGSQILAGSVIGVGSVLGESCIVNTSSSIDHECVLQSGVHIAPGARLAGSVQVGENSFIGTGAVILPRIKIGKDVIVGAGAVVIKDVVDGQIIVGNPSRPLFADPKDLGLGQQVAPQKKQ